jgi:ubiquitin-conjugating enzyme E2 G2
MSAAAAKRLATEFANMSRKPTPGIVARPAGGDNLMTWEFALAGPPGTDYEHGVFTGRLFFPGSYPLEPPRMVFEPPITHPNVYGAGARRGEVCISILHAGRDATGYERVEERWSPVQSVYSVLLSVLSMLAEPNTESPANVDAAKLFAQHPAQFREVVRREVARSLGLPAPPPPPAPVPAGAAATAAGAAAAGAAGAPLAS